MEEEGQAGPGGSQVATACKQPSSPKLRQRETCKGKQLRYHVLVQRNLHLMS